MIVAFFTYLTTFGLLVGRLVGSYALSWAVGAVATGFVMLRGTRVERCVLLILFGLAVASGEQAAIGIRLTTFAAMFMLFGRYLTVNPFWLFAMQLAFLPAAFATGNVELYVFAPAILLLLFATLTEQARGGGNGQGTTLRVTLLSVASLAFAGIGFGSRSAILVWLAASIRRLSFAILAAALVIIPAVVVIASDVPIIAKLGNSFGELTQPVDEATGSISQRGIEALIFIGWVDTATPRELLFGSTERLYEPGDLLGHDDDPPFIPHNQVFGWFFQFGAVGITAIAVYLVTLYRRFAPNRGAQFLLLVLLPPCFLFKHAFIDSDLAMLVSALNWAVVRRPFVGSTVAAARVDGALVAA